MLIDVCLATTCVVVPPRHPFFKRAIPTLVSIHAAASAAPASGFVLTGKPEAKAASQSVAAHEIACKAAWAVLQRRFPEEHFIVDSHMD